MPSDVPRVWSSCSLHSDGGTTRRETKRSERSPPSGRGPCRVSSGPDNLPRPPWNVDRPRTPWAGCGVAARFPVSSMCCRIRIWSCDGPQPRGPLYGGRTAREPEAVAARGRGPPSEAPPPRRAHDSPVAGIRGSTRRSFRRDPRRRTCARRRDRRFGSVPWGGDGGGSVKTSTPEARIVGEVSCSWEKPRGQKTLITGVPIRLACPPRDA